MLLYRTKYTYNYSNGFGSHDSETRGSGTLLGFNLEVGGDHYLSPNFALGLEAGADGTYALGVHSKDNPTNYKQGFASSLLYGALRATIVF